jgi:hypothetical protein
MADSVSRRSVLNAGAAAASGAALLAAGSANAQDADSNDGQSFTTASEPWAPLRVIDLDRMPWEESPRWQRKSLFVDPKTQSHLFMLMVDPGWHGIPSHYHEFHEWAYCLTGDMTNNEFLTPNQTISTLNLYREGVWLDRPPYSLHGIHSTDIISEVGCTLIIQEEGVVTYRVSETEGPYPFRPNPKEVKTWGMPRIVDTIRDMGWEDHATIEGLAVKPLADDPGRGFRGNLFWLKPGWTSESSADFARPYYRNSGREFNIVLSGAMSLQAYADPDTPAETITVERNTFFDRGPKCIVGLPDGQVTERGCVWLQVTYADEGGVVSDKAIEQPVYI